MEKIPVWVYIAVMAGVTYAIRCLPFTLFRKKIESAFIRSLLYYLPYAVLTAMTIPAIFSSTGSVLSGIAGFAAAFICALRGRPLLFVAVAACVSAFAVDLIIMLV